VGICLFIVRFFLLGNMILLFMPNKQTTKPSCSCELQVSYPVQCIGHHFIQGTLQHHHYHLNPLLKRKSSKLSHLCLFISNSNDIYTKYILGKKALLLTDSQYTSSVLAPTKLYILCVVIYIFLSD
jgi:hypothetical protein